MERMLRNEQELPRNPDEPGLQSKWQAKNLNELTLGYHFNVSLKVVTFPCQKCDSLIVSTENDYIVSRNRPREN